MKMRLFRLIGKILIIIGIPMFFLLSISIYAVITYTGEYGPLSIEVGLLPGYLLLDIGMISFGFFIIRRFQEKRLFLTRDGEPIHSVKPWKKGSEPGLFLTSCGLVVSINQESSATGHVGYRMVPAKSATHRECAVKEGKNLLDLHAQRRTSY